MTALHEDAREVLNGWPAPTAEQASLRQEYVDHLTRHPDGCSRSCFPDHITASAAVLSADLSQALLTLHAKAHAWFQLGGHCEADDATLAAAAAREAREESGVADLVVDTEPVHLDAHLVGFCDPRGPVRHLDVRFLAVAAPGASPTVSAESHDVRWWPVEELPTQEPGVVELVRLALSRARRL